MNKGMNERMNERGTLALVRRELDGLRRKNFNLGILNEPRESRVRYRSCVLSVESFVHAYYNVLPFYRRYTALEIISWFESKGQHQILNKL